MRRFVFGFLLVSAHLLLTASSSQGQPPPAVFAEIDSVGPYKQSDGDMSPLVIGQGVDYSVSVLVSNSTDFFIESVDFSTLTPFDPFPVSPPMQHDFVPPIAPNAGATDTFNFELNYGTVGSTTAGVVNGVATATNGFTYNLNFGSQVGLVINVEVRKKGDMNGDGAVDFADFLAFSTALEEQPFKPGYSGGDFNLDGQVNFADFLIFSSGWEG